MEEPALARPLGRAAGAPHVLAGLSVVLPCARAEVSVADAIHAAAEAAAASSADYEIVVVDDGSSDGTARSASRLVDGGGPVRLLVHPYRRGRGAAVRTGLAAARMPWILILSVAEEFDAADMAAFAALTESADVIVGRRMQRTGTLADRVGGAAWNRLLRVLFDLPVDDVDCATKLIRRDLLDGMQLRASGPLIDAELLVRCRADGARISQHVLLHRPRRSGKQGGARTLSALGELVRLQGQLRRLPR